MPQDIQWTFAVSELTIHNVNNDKSFIGIEF